MKPQIMLCWNCGAKNDTTNTFCHRYGEGLDNLQSNNLHSHNIELNNLQSNPNYTRIFSIKGKDLISNEFNVFEKNQLKYKIQTKKRLWGVILVPIFFVLICIFFIVSIILSATILPDNDTSLTFFVIISIGLVTVSLIFLLVIFIDKIVFYTIIDDCVINHTIGRVSTKDLKHNEWVFKKNRSNLNLTMTFATKMGGYLQRQNDICYFSKNEAVPEIDLSTDNKKILRFMLGPEYEKGTGYYRKEFQIQSDETLTEPEMLFFASVIISKFKSRIQKNRRRRHDIFYIDP